MPLEQPKWHYSNCSKLKLKKEKKKENEKKRLNKQNVYGKGIAAFYIANRNVATTHLNNQSGTIATLQNLN